MTRIHLILRRPFTAWRPVASAALVITVLALAACGGDDDTVAPAPTQPAAASSPAQSAPAIAVADNSFSPGSLTVKAGTKVTWTWGGKNPHSVVGKFDGQDVKSEQLTGTGTFAFTFAKAGTFEYQCGVHGAAMTGKVIVQ